MKSDAQSFEGDRDGSEVARVITKWRQKDIRKGSEETAMFNLVFSTAASYLGLERQNEVGTTQQQNLGTQKTAVVNNHMNLMFPNEPTETDIPTFGHRGSYDMDMDAQCAGSAFQPVSKRQPLIDLELGPNPSGTLKPLSDRTNKRKDPSFELPDENDCTNQKPKTRKHRLKKSLSPLSTEEPLEPQEGRKRKHSTRDNNGIPTSTNDSSTPSVTDNDALSKPTEVPPARDTPTNSTASIVDHEAPPKPTKQPKMPSVNRVLPSCESSENSGTPKKPKIGQTSTTKTVKISLSDLQSRPATPVKRLVSSPIIPIPATAKPFTPRKKTKTNVSELTKETPTTSAEISAAPTSADSKTQMLNQPFSFDSKGSTLSPFGVETTKTDSVTSFGAKDFAKTDPTSTSLSFHSNIQSSAPKDESFSLSAQPKSDLPSHVFSFGAAPQNSEALKAPPPASSSFSFAFGTDSRVPTKTDPTSFSFDPTNSNPSSAFSFGTDSREDTATKVNSQGPVAPPKMDSPQNPFSFGTTNSKDSSTLETPVLTPTASKTDSTTPFSFGATTNPESSSSFSFSADLKDSTTSAKIETPTVKTDSIVSFSFGATTNPDSSSPFSFGAAPKDSTASAQVETPTAATTDSTTPFSFGTRANADSSSSFSFGTDPKDSSATSAKVETPSAKTDSSPNPFSFGTDPKPSTVETPTAAKTDSTTPFSFGATTNPNSTSSFSFGTDPKPSTVETPIVAKTDSTASFSFGATTNAGSASFPFGTNLNEPTTSPKTEPTTASPFSFGAVPKDSSATAKAESTSPFSFRAVSKDSANAPTPNSSTSSVTSPFSFGTDSKDSFGADPKDPPAQVDPTKSKKPLAPFSFGVAKDSPFSFGTDSKDFPSNQASKDLVEITTVSFSAGPSTTQTEVPKDPSPSSFSFEATEAPSSSATFSFGAPVADSKAPSSKNVNEPVNFTTAFSFVPEAIPKETSTPTQPTTTPRSARSRKSSQKKTSPPTPLKPLTETTHLKPQEGPTSQPTEKKQAEASPFSFDTATNGATPDSSFTLEPTKEKESILPAPTQTPSPFSFGLATSNSESPFVFEPSQPIPAPALEANKPTEKQVEISPFSFGSATETTQQDSPFTFEPPKGKESSLPSTSFSFGTSTAPTPIASVKPTDPKGPTINAFSFGAPSGSGSKDSSTNAFSFNGPAKPSKDPVTNAPLDSNPFSLSKTDSTAPANPFSFGGHSAPSPFPSDPKNATTFEVQTPFSFGASTNAPQPTEQKQKNEPKTEGPVKLSPASPSNSSESTSSEDDTSNEEDSSNEEKPEEEPEEKRPLKTASITSTLESKKTKRENKFLKSDPQPRSMVARSQSPSRELPRKAAPQPTQPQTHTRTQPEATRRIVTVRRTKK